LKNPKIGPEFFPFHLSLAADFVYILLFSLRLLIETKYAQQAKNSRFTGKKRNAGSNQHHNPDRNGFGVFLLVYHTPDYREIGDYHDALNTIIGNDMVIRYRPKSNYTNYGNQASHIKPVKVG
jgi:hypothetical protein